MGARALFEGLKSAGSVVTEVDLSSHLISSPYMKKMIRFVSECNQFKVLKLQSTH